MAAVSGNDLWAVGSGFNTHGDEKTQVERFTNPCIRPTNTPVGTATPTSTATDYVVVTATGTVVPGTTDIGNHCDSCVTRVLLPFPVTLYDGQFSSAIVGSNGTLGFVSNANPDTNSCLSSTAFNFAILPFWDNLDTRTSLLTCPSCGIYTSVSGSTPNRIFNIEWRATRLGGRRPMDFEVRLFERTKKIDIIYGVLDSSATESAGVQRDTGSLFTQLTCNLQEGADGGIIAEGMMVSFIPPAGGPTPTPTACPIQFTDLPQGSTFYPFIRCLACLGIMNGYSDGTFRPNNNVTRGQVAKMVSNAVGLNDEVAEQLFEDVPAGSTFFDFVQRLGVRGYMSGYPCGGPGEPCGPSYLPYFRPNGTATRGQVAKIVSNAASFEDQPPGQTYEDVAPDATFYAWVERLGTRGVINGYPCGGPGEPCIPACQQTLLPPQ